MQKLGEINGGLEAAKLELQAQINNLELIMKEVSISNVFLLKP